MSLGLYSQQTHCPPPKKNAGSYFGLGENLLAFKKKNVSENISEELKPIQLSKHKKKL